MIIPVYIQYSAVNNIFSFNVFSLFSFFFNILDNTGDIETMKYDIKWDYVISKKCENKAKFVFDF